jgi:hypothetical protein
MCQAHHCRHWIDDGETSVDNCVLLCEAHHQHVHHTGWDILVDHGHVEFIPPAIIDPTRTPLHNPSAASTDCSPMCSTSIRARTGERRLGWQAGVHEARAPVHGPGAHRYRLAGAAGSRAGRADEIDLLETAGGAVAKRVVPAITAVVLLALVVCWLLRRPRRSVDLGDGRAE